MNTQSNCRAKNPRIKAMLRICLAKAFAKQIMLVFCTVLHWFGDKQCPYVQRRLCRRWTYGGERSRNGGFPVVSFRVLCRPPVLRGPEFRFHFNEHHRKTAEKRGSFRFCRARSVRAAGGGDRNRGNKRGFLYIKRIHMIYTKSRDSVFCFPCTVPYNGTMHGFMSGDIQKGD